MLEKILASLDLSPEEIRIYMQILEMGGGTTAGDLAKKLGLARPTLYGILQRLTDKGIIQRSLKYGVRRFAATAPDKLDMLFKQRIEHLQTQQKAYQEILPQLLSKHRLETLSPRFQYFEGKEGVQHVLKDMLSYRDMETLAFWPIKSMIAMLSEDFFRYHNKERIRNNLYTRAIWPQAEAVEVKANKFLGVGNEFRREIRLAPTEVNFTMGYWMYGNKIAFLSSQAECFGMIVESHEMVAMQRAAFEVIWNISAPLKVNPKDTQEFLDEMKRGR